MSGLIFFSTGMLEEVVRFYTERVGMDIWLEQEDCTILKHDNLMVGFCQRTEADLGGMITFYFESREEVDAAYQKHRAIAVSIPQQNERYEIYHFFAKDPEGRTIEFQKFCQTSSNHANSQ